MIFFCRICDKRSPELFHEKSRWSAPGLVPIFQVFQRLLNWSGTFAWNEHTDDIIKSRAIESRTRIKTLNRDNKAKCQIEASNKMMNNNHCPPISPFLFKQYFWNYFWHKKHILLLPSLLLVFFEAIPLFEQ